MPGLRAAASTRTAVLARLKVGTKLMLLVLLPVCVLLAFTTVTAVADWRSASELGAFRTATQLSAATAGLADKLAAERTASVLARLRPGGQATAALALAQRDTDQALRQAERDAASWQGAVDVAGRLDAARRQLGALRLQAAAGSLSVQGIQDSYSVIVSNLIATVGSLIAGRPTRASGRATDAYLAILQAVEAAQHEGADVAAALSAPGPDQTAAASRWATLESAELNAFRQNAAGRLTADLEGVLFGPAGITVQRVRDEFRANPGNAVAHTSLGTWLDASGARIDGLRSLESGAAGDLAATASHDHRSAQAGGIRDLSLSLAVLAIVTALGLALRRSITRPLSEVSRGARTLSGGDLNFDVSYAGRDEIGDVAAAFRDLHLTAGRLTGEIRATTAAISDNRLDHRADVSAFQGTWAQLLAGMNDTTAAFARLHRRRRQAERELEGIFNLSLDLLCISGRDGHFKRVNPAFERTLGYTSEELLSRPFVSFVHPDDRARTTDVHDGVVRGYDVGQFENRYIRSDGAVRWLQWSARSVPEEGLVYAAARDVTESRRASQEQAALRRVATLVARGVVPEEVFDAVVTEMHLLLDADNTRLLRYEPGDKIAVVASRSDPAVQVPPVRLYSLEGQSVAAAVWHSGRPARLDSFEGPPGSIGEILRRLGIASAAGAPIIVEGRLWGVMVAAWQEAPQSPGIEERIAQFTELIATAISNAQAQADLAASRARIVAASDETRRRIERDLHDGAQQRLVSLGLGLGAVRDALPSDHGDLRQELTRVTDGLSGVLDDLRELSHGIHPAILSVGGLDPALRALARRSAVPVELDVRVQARPPERVEVAAYFVVCEALANAAKHARASVVRVCVREQEGVLKVQISDDGIGGADPSRGSGLIGLADRVEALNGTINVSSHPGAGTQIQAEFTVAVLAGQSLTFKPALTLTVGL
jgi:PAS domain S-box-containing protein